LELPANKLDSEKIGGLPKFLVVQAAHGIVIELPLCHSAPLDIQRGEILEICNEMDTAAENGYLWVRLSNGDRLAIDREVLKKMLQNGDLGVDERNEERSGLRNILSLRLSRAKEIISTLREVFKDYDGRLIDRRMICKKLCLNLPVDPETINEYLVWLMATVDIRRKIRKEVENCFRQGDSRFDMRRMMGRSWKKLVHAGIEVDDGDELQSLDRMILETLRPRIGIRK